MEEIPSSKKVVMFTTSLLFRKVTTSIKIKQNKVFKQTKIKWTLGNTFYSFTLEMKGRQNVLLTINL
jgi:hypothetical protein